MFPQYYCFPSWHTHFSRVIFYFPYDCTLLVCFALCFFIHRLICIFIWYYFSFNEPPHRRYWGIMHFYTNSATSGHLGMLICCISCLLTGYFNFEQCKWDGIFLFFSFFGLFSSFFLWRSFILHKLLPMFCQNILFRTKTVGQCLKFSKQKRHHPHNPEHGKQKIQ